MPSKLDVKLESNYIYFELSGRRTIGNEIEEETALFTNIIEICDTYNQTKILAQSNIHGRMPVAGILDVIEAIQPLITSKTFKISIIVPDAVHYANLSIFEKVSRRLGLDTRIFKSKREAKKWLLT